MRFFFGLFALITLPVAAQTRQAPLAVLPDGVEPVEFATVMMTMVTDVGEFPMFLELAMKPEQYVRGLKFRSDLPDDYGMLFLFSDSQPRQFWMQDTLSPLDIVFIREDGLIDTIHHGVPLSEKGLQSESAVKFVLELRHGLADIYGLREGGHVMFK